MLLRTPTHGSRLTSEVNLCRVDTLTLKHLSEADPRVLIYTHNGISWNCSGFAKQMSYRKWHTRSFTSPKIEKKRYTATATAARACSTTYGGYTEIRCENLFHRTHTPRQEIALNWNVERIAPASCVCVCSLSSHNHENHRPTLALICDKHWKMLEIHFNSSSAVRMLAHLQPLLQIVKEINGLKLQ